MIPASSEPITVSLTFSRADSRSSKPNSFTYPPISDFAKRYFPVAVLITAYSISGPTARAKFVGNVHGVVVHASIFTPAYLPSVIGKVTVTV